MDASAMINPIINDAFRMSKNTSQAKMLEHKSSGIGAAAHDRKAASIAKPAEIDRHSKLFSVCKDFESLFIKQMLDVMRKSVPKDGILEGGFAEDIFDDMLYDEYSKKMADTAKFGIAETIYNQYSRYVKE
jgi:flagellar protein FlgJ